MLIRMDDFYAREILSMINVPRTEVDINASQNSSANDKDKKSVCLW